MAKKEVKTDYWVAEQLKGCKIPFDPQGSEIKEVGDALKTASKNGKGNVGFPEFVSVVKDYLIVIEDKARIENHICLRESGVVDMSCNSVENYAVNGAIHYGRHIAQNTNFHKVFAIGVSGDPKHHRITPSYVDDRGEYVMLDDVDSFVYFEESNIDEYYTRNVLKEGPNPEKTVSEILRDAAILHNAFRDYGAISDQQKPLIVSGILLALSEIDKGFSIESLIGDSLEGSRDGDKIVNAIESRMKRSNVGPDAKRDKMLHQFKVISDNERINDINPVLGKTPLRYYTEFLYENVYRNIKYTQSSEDFIGRFYGEFMSYSGGDGQTLGIVLTPRHICDLMCDLVDVGPKDVVLDPTCGTGGFLISAMHRMLSTVDDDSSRRKIKTRCLHGIESQDYMFVIAASNMILRGDGNSNLRCCDFLKENTDKLQEKGCTVGLMNPPYSQGKKEDPDQYEISFTKHLLDSLVEGGRAAVIVPQSSMTGKTNIEKRIKSAILKEHTLEGVITCNTDTFYGVGVNPVIAVFTAHIPHDPKKLCKFIDFRDDGYVVRAHIGLVEGNNVMDRKQYLLDVWNGRAEAPSKFCVETTVEDTDEWLHSFFYFNDEIPTDADFEKAIGDYLTFEFSMVMQGREYLFRRND